MPLHLDHLSFLEHFDGIVALVVLGLHQVHASEAARAERALDGKVLQRVLALGHARLRVRLRQLHAAIGRLGRLRRLRLLLLRLLRIVGGRGIVVVVGMLWRCGCWAVC